MKYDIQLEIPASYKCSRCGVHGVKLWRQSNVTLEYVELMCGECTKAYQEEVGIQIDALGKHYDPVLGAKCEAIGSMVPAVPDESEETFWGYSAVPEAGVRWWRTLLTKKSEEG